MCRLEQLNKSQLPKGRKVSWGIKNKDMTQKLQFKYKYIKGYLREHLKI